MEIILSEAGSDARGWQHKIQKLQLIGYILKFQQRFGKTNSLLNSFLHALLINPAQGIVILQRQLIHHPLLLSG